MVIDEISRGDTVGERSLLTGDVRSATVYALRDSAVGSSRDPFSRTWSTSIQR